VLTLQLIAAGLLLLGSGLVIRTVIALDAPRPAPAHPTSLPLAAAPQRRTALPERRAA
jgi:hypothetical protein